MPIGLDPARFDGAIFDMDGVITDTADMHALAWKRLFDEYLLARSERLGEAFVPFDLEQDYLPYVDGKARADGVRDFLASRGIELPDGTEDDPIEAGTASALAAAKNRYFRELVERDGVRVFPEVAEVLERLRAAGLRTAVVSASRNAPEVIRATGIAHLFDACVDGNTARELGLPGKPQPAIFLEAARRLGIAPDRAVLFEDAEAGVEAGRRGSFGLVVGVDRDEHGDALRVHGADELVSDLADVAVVKRVPIRELADALGGGEDLERRLRGKRLAVVLDYDGTLTPIVDDPDAAVLGDRTRERVARLAECTLVAIASGRDVSFVREQLRLESVVYLGSHGFDIVAPPGLDLDTGKLRRFDRFLDSLDAAEREARALLGEIEGARVERKKFAIAAHYRQVPADRIERVAAAVDDIAAYHVDLRVTGGKKVLELRPDVEWDKGRAVRWMLSALGRDTDRDLAVYVGDDLTDEDAFVAVYADGVGIAVGDDDRASAATMRVADTDAVGRLLELLAEWTEGC